MASQHPKAVRRRILQILYEHYMNDPHEMLGPQEILEDGTLPRDRLAANAHYLHDRGLVELMMGYNPPLFAAARITADGIDLVENRFEFNLLFPPAPGEQEEATAHVPVLVERLVEEAEFAPLDGEARKCLLRDVQYLREELSRPVARWRTEVVETVLGWMAAHFDDPDEMLPSLGRLREAIVQQQQAEANWQPDSRS